MIASQQIIWKLLRILQLWSSLSLLELSSCHDYLQVSSVGLYTCAEILCGKLYTLNATLCVVCSTAVTVLGELYGIKAKAEDFIPFAGMGEANFLGGVARKYGTEVDIAATKRRFFEIYLAHAANPDYKIGYPGQKLSIMLPLPKGQDMCTDKRTI